MRWVTSFAERHHLSGLPCRIHAAVVLLLALGLIALILAFLQYRDVDVWAGWVPSRELHQPVYAERVIEESIFRTRANTWSNYAFVIVGVCIMGLAWADRVERRERTAGYVVQRPLFSVQFGAGCIFLGVGSGVFHASLTRFGQQLDVASMYAPFLAIIAMNCSRLVEPFLRWQIAVRWAFAAMAVLAVVVLYIYKWHMSASNVLAVLIIMIMGFLVLDAIRARSSFLRWWLALAAGIFALALAIRQLDVAGRLTGPDAWAQGHAIWHVLSAAAFGCMYMYYRSERVAE